jgi:hypothetical protein
MQPPDQSPGSTNATVPHAVLVVQMDPVLAPVVTVRDELEVPAEQRVEVVRHPHTSVPIIWTGCR